MSQQLLLGVNIDHIATLRQARGTNYPCPVFGAQLAAQAGADGITLHLREDRRHVQEQDVELIHKLVDLPLNFEMAVTDFMVNYALELKPEHVCLVPERREEITTEGGLDVITHRNQIQVATQELQAQGSEVSLFIDPDLNQIDAAAALGAKAIELHTGSYAEAKSKTQQAQELQRIQIAAAHALKAGLVVNAGHGLHYHNVLPIAAIPGLNELNIGHALIARAVFTGLTEAIQAMRQLMLSATK